MRIKVIPTNFALLLPNWDSLDSVRGAHSHLELWSIQLFAILVVCDVIAHLIQYNHRETAKIAERIGLVCFTLAVIGELGAYEYGQRNDELSGRQIASLDTLAKEAETSAREAKTKADEAKTTAAESKTKAELVGKMADESKRKIVDVNKRAGVLTYMLSARRVNDEKGLENDLKAGFVGAHITFDSYVGDQEAYLLCAQLARIALKAGVEATDACATRHVSRIPISDLHVDAPTLDEAERLSGVLMKPGRVLGRFVGFNFTPAIVVTVGVKAPVPLLTPMPKPPKRNPSKTAPVAPKPIE